MKADFKGTLRLACVACGTHVYIYKASLASLSSYAYGLDDTEPPKKILINATTAELLQPH